MGKVQEWLNWQHWKCCVRQRTVGSNPTLSAICQNRPLPQTVLTLPSGGESHDQI